MITDFVHNGAEILSERAPAPSGPFGNTVLGVVGTAPNIDPDIPLSTPFRVASPKDAARLDTKGTGLGTAVQFCNLVLAVSNVPIYVVIETGDNADAIKTAIAGGTDADGQRTGIHALTECSEKPTHIFAPGYSNHSAVSQELVAIGKRISAVPVGDGLNTTDTAQITAMATMPGVGTGYENLYLVDNWAYVANKATKADVLAPASTLAATCFARVLPWVSPGSDGAIICKSLSRTIDYDAMDKTSQANLLMKNGVSILTLTSEGYKLKGNRCIHGRFVNLVGLEYAIIRKLSETSERDMGVPLTERFMKQKIRNINRMLQNMKLQEALAGAEVFLHPTYNNPENYMSGRWYIAIKYAGYRPNEHMIYVLQEDEGIIEEFVEGIA